LDIVITYGVGKIVWEIWGVRFMTKHNFFQQYSDIKTNVQ